MSDSRSRIADFRSRPSSEQLVDLHIYVVPPELWRQKHHDVLNTDVNETISAGFIRVHPENKVFTLRDDIDQQLGVDVHVIPKDYVLMKCVGRSLTRVKPKQEYQLKVKTFLPPLAYLPEVYLLEISPNERHIYGLSSGEGSSRTQTRTSLRPGESPHPHGYRNRYSEDDLDRYNSGISKSGGSTQKLSPLDPQRHKLKSRSSHRTGFSVDTYATNSTKNSAAESQGPGPASGLTLSSSSEPRKYGVLLEVPSEYRSSSRNPSPRISSKPPTPAPNPDTTGRSHNDASFLPPISNQSRSTPPQQHARSTPDYSKTYRPEGRSDGQRQDHSQETDQSPDRGDHSEPHLSATPPQTSDRHRKAHPDERERGVRRQGSPDDAYGGNPYDGRGNKTYRARNGDLEDEEARARLREARKREEEEARRRQREEEQRRQDEQLRQWQEERRDAQNRLEEESREREHENEMERQRLLAEQEMLDVLDEERRREEIERRRRQEQEDLQRQEEEEARRRHEAEEEAHRREAEEEERRRRAAEEEEYRRRQDQEASLQRQQEEADLRRIEEERRKLQNDELLKADVDEQTQEELSRFPSPPPLHTTSPDREVSEEDKNRKKAEREKLQSQLEKAREQRRAVERQREDLVKKAKMLQTKTQNRRNHARDVWKKRYFEEKKKTSPLEDQCNRLRQEVDQIHRKLMSTLEGPKDPKGGKIANKTPSEKNNYKIQATRLQHEIEDLKRRVENAKMKLTAEMKLRNQAETELRALRAELTQKKINLTLSRSQQLQTLASGNDLAYMTPRTMISPQS